MPAGGVVSTTGTYIDTLRYTNGCDSLITTMYILKLPTLVYAKTISLCGGQSFTMPASGLVVSQPGRYNDTIPSTFGCDSIITVYNIVVRAVVVQRFNSSMCEGETFTLPWGTVIRVAGVYYDTIRSASGCDSIIKAVSVLVKAAPTVRVTKSNDINCNLAFSTLTATGGIKYLWSSASSISNPTSANPVVTPSQTSDFKVQVTGFNGCTSFDSITVKVNNNVGEVVLPTAFTPNGDGRNDCFGVRALGNLTDLRFSIFNRWGQVVFSTTDASQCWDGTFKGQPQPAGTFVYKVQANALCGPVNTKGTIILIR